MYTTAMFTHLNVMPCIWTWYHNIYAYNFTRVVSETTDL